MLHTILTRFLPASRTVTALVPRDRPHPKDTQNVAGDIADGRFIPEAADFDTGASWRSDYAGYISKRTGYRWRWRSGASEDGGMEM